MSEGLLDNHSAPVTIVLFGQARASEVLDDVAEKLGRGRHIKEIVLTGAVLLVDFGQGFA